MAALRAAFLPVLALSCVHARPEAEPSSPLRGIDFSAEVALVDAAPARVVPSVTIRNRRGTGATLTFPIACMGLLRAYEPGVTVPVWEQSPGERCRPDSLHLSLDPGEERRVAMPEVGAQDILGEGLHEGTYRFTVLLVPDGHVLEIQAGEISLQRSQT